jgi:hypothetical protein
MPKALSDREQIIAYLEVHSLARAKELRAIPAKQINVGAHS